MYGCFEDFLERDKISYLFDFVGLAIFLEEKLHRRIDIVPVDTILKVRLGMQF
jgi:hypothetical protein